ncbi:restriction endonuclease [Candidatus Peribacteria bacterium]|nr:MAG: restriction endonuclease [Candidatus Peribacteria bacterium]
MSTYDFLRLSPVDFEELVHDLLEKKLGLHLEAFSDGKDGGIDLRHIAKTSFKKTTIIQCKRTQKWSDLRSSLLKEVKKVTALKPDRYIVITSATLTPSNKKEIEKMFEPYITNPADIIGEKEVNQLLRVHKDILEGHCKLWLPDATVLQKILHSSTKNLSEFTEEKIAKDLELYVKNESYQEAMVLLKQHKYCVISGKPGIGKTTLARMITYHYLSKGYELVHISGDITEGLTMFSEGKKQVFYYDDFLGKNFLHQYLTKNEDERILTFIEKIKKSKNKRLILTTREYILNQAKDQYETLDQQKVDFSKCIIDLESYTKIERARIFYNHLFFSPLPKKLKEDLCKNKGYMQIIGHKNYDPRIILHLTARTDVHSAAAFIKEAIQQLNDPSIIWSHAFEKQITESSKSLLFTLYGFRNGEKASRIERAWEAYETHTTSVQHRTRGSNDFPHAIKELERSLITVNKIDDDIFLNFYDPSVADFLLARIKEKPMLIADMIEHAIFWEQVVAYANINLHTVDIELVKARLHLPSSMRKTHSQKLDWFTAFANNKEVVHFLTKEIEELIENKDIDSALFTLLANTPHLNIDYQQTFDLFAETVQDIDSLRSFMDAINRMTLQELIKRENIDVTPLEERASDIASDLSQMGDGCLQFDNDDYFIGDEGEVMEYIDDIAEINTYFRLNFDSDIDRLQEAVERTRPDFEYDDDYEGGRWSSGGGVASEDKEIERMFDAGF